MKSRLTDVNVTKGQRRGLAIGLLVLSALGAGLAAILAQPGATREVAARNYQAPGTTSVFTPAHENVMQAVKEFFGMRPKPVQPIAFSHKVHLGEKVPCEMCHLGFSEGPQAGLPDIRVCMSCHGMIATDRPEVQKVRAYADRGEDIPWQRVYGFFPSAHLKFNHAPHIHAGVGCAKCHGDLAQQATAVRAVNHTMGFCLDCHREKKAPVDCLTCHY